MFSKLENYYIDTNLKVLALLQEAYKKPELNWVDSFVDYLYDSPKISRDYIVNKWNVRLEINNYDDYTIVEDASYSPDLNVITLFLNNNIGEKSRQDVKTEIKRFIFHELYHYQQANNGEKPSKQERENRFKAFYDSNLSSIDKKLLTQEVDAHAKDYARIYQERGFSVKEAIKSISFGNNKNLFSPIELAEIELYRSHRAVWRRLLIEMYRFYTEE